MKKYFIKLFFSLLGIIMLSLFIWVKFIRVRLPKELPFMLSTYGFLILSYICIVYLIVTIIYIKYKQLEANKIKTLEANVSGTPISYGRFRYIYELVLYKFIQRVIFLFTNIFKPLKILDETIKSNEIFNKYFNKILFTFLSVIQSQREIIFYHFIKSNNIVAFFFTLKQKDFDYIDETPFSVKSYKIFYFLIQLLPRIILLLIFLIDVFYFSCLFYIYKIVYIYLLILFCKYLTYSARYAKEQFIVELEKNVDCVCNLSPRFKQDDFYDDDEGKYDTPETFCGRSIRRFIEIQTNVLVFGDYEYEITHYHYSFMQKNNILKKDIKIHCVILTENALFLSVFLENYAMISQSNDTIRYIKIIIFGLYCISWSYILLLNVFETLMFATYMP